MSKQLDQLAALTAAQKTTSDNLAALTAAISNQESPADLTPVIQAEQQLAAAIADLTAKISPPAPAPVPEPIAAAG